MTRTLVLRREAVPDVERDLGGLLGVARGEQVDQLVVQLDRGLAMAAEAVTLRSANQRIEVTVTP